MNKSKIWGFKLQDFEKRIIQNFNFLYQDPTISNDA